MNPLDALGNFAFKFVHEGHLQAWIKLGISIAITAFVTFFGTFGLTGLALISSQNNYTLIFVISLLTACLHMALAVLTVFLKCPIAKDIPVAYFGKLEVKRIELLVNEGTVFNPNKQ